MMDANKTGIHSVLIDLIDVLAELDPRIPAEDVVQGRMDVCKITDELQATFLANEMSKHLYSWLHCGNHDFAFDLADRIAIYLKKCQPEPTEQKTYRSFFEKFHMRTAANQ